MPKNLDKLKALTDRLDKRLTHKREASHSIKYSSKNTLSSSPSISKSLNETVDLINASQAFQFEEKQIKDQKLVQETTPFKVKYNPLKQTKQESILLSDEELNQPIIEVEPEVDITEEKSPEETSKAEITVLIKAEEAEDIRQNNIYRVKELYEILNIYEKSPDFDQIFMYKAMNLSGIGLKDEDFGIIRRGKYIQIIAITYEPDASGKKKAKNISLGYFGKGETIDPELKNNIIEFVLCWRYEKAFQNVEHYKNLLSRVEKQLKKETISL